MNSEHNVLPVWKNLRSVNVSGESDSNRTNNQKSGVPGGKRVSWDIDGDNGLDERANKEDANCIP
jgi:hypothetical protein